MLNEMAERSGPREANASTSSITGCILLKNVVFAQEDLVDTCSMLQAQPIYLRFARVVSCKRVSSPAKSCCLILQDPLTKHDRSSVFDVLN